MLDHLSSPLRTDVSQHHNVQTMPPASIPPPSVIHGMPPPPLPNQVLPNMVTVIPGLPPFNTNQLTHLPPPPPLVSTHLPPPLLSPGAIPPPPLPQSSALVTQEQVYIMCAVIYLYTMCIWLIVHLCVNRPTQKVYRRVFMQHFISTVYHEQLQYLDKY